VSKSLSPVLLTGGITFANKWYTSGSLDLKILVATGIAAGGFSLLETAPGFAGFATGLAWCAFVTSLLVGNPSPFQTLKKATGI
jgi:hypothetical protein